MKNNNILSKIVLATIAILCFSFATTKNANAGVAITVSPMNQTKVLVPGKVEQGNFTIANPVDKEEDLNYELIIRPFFYSNKEEISYEAHDDYSQIVDWIKLDKTTGTLKPGEREVVNFAIKAPEDAPAGGQYAAIVVHGIPEHTDAMIVNNFEVAHLVYAEVAGETRHGGRVLEMDVPGFILSSKIIGATLVQNDGNIHAKAKQTLRVLPLFGDEEYFSNVDDPKETLLMPGANQYMNVTWDETPTVGIFRIEYSVEFEGVIERVEKIVIVCPLWLLIVIGLLLVVLIYRVVTGSKKKSAAKPAEA